MLYGIWLWFILSPLAVLGAIEPQHRSRLANTKKTFWTVIFVWIAAGTIVFPFVCDHLSTSNWELGHSSLSLSYRDFSLWELAAILQSLVISLMLLLEKRPSFRKAQDERWVNILLGIVMFGLVVVAAFTLGNDEEVVHRFAVLGTLLVFYGSDMLLAHQYAEAAKTVSDPKVKREAEAARAEFHDLISFVDRPTIIATVILTVFVFTFRKDSAAANAFYAGGIAFSLVAANLLILSVRVRQKLI